MLGSMGQMQGVTNTVVSRLSNQLDESRGQVDKLIAALLEYRFKVAQADVAERTDERDSDARRIRNGERSGPEVEDRARRRHRDAGTLKRRRRLASRERARQGHEGNVRAFPERTSGS